MPLPSYSASDFLAARQNLLPPGMAWPRDADAVITKFLAALAQTDWRLASRGRALVVDAFPATTIELLPEWEASLGLPDPCAGPAPSIVQREAQVVARLIASGGQSVPYFISVALALGYTVTVTEFATFRAGIGHAGDPIYGADWAHAWQINAPLNSVTFFEAGHSAAGDPLASWGNTVLECEMNRIKPAHTVLIFSYT
jgi:uncharacterized protein YmfQ (DUF2313 family)